MPFEKRNNVILNCVDRRVTWRVSEPMKVDVQRMLSQHCNHKQVLEIISNGSFKSTVEVDFKALVICDHSRVKLEKCAAFCYHGLRTVGDCLYQS